MTASSRSSRSRNSSFAAWSSASSTYRRPSSHKDPPILLMACSFRTRGRRSRVAAAFLSPPYPTAETADPPSVGSDVGVGTTRPRFAPFRCWGNLVLPAWTPPRRRAADPVDIDGTATLGDFLPHGPSPHAPNPSHRASCRCAKHGRASVCSASASVHSSTARRSTQTVNAGFSWVS